MKKILLLTAIVLGIGSASALTTHNDGVIKVKTSKVGRNLVDLWIKAYREEHPEVQIEVVTGKAKDADLTLVSTESENVNVTYVGRYALLPVTSATNPLREDIERKTWSAKDLKRLFFVDEDFDDEDFDNVRSRKDKLADKLTVYTGSHSNSWTPALAAYFGHTKDELKGNKVAGDDYYLLNAIEEEPASVTFSSLTFLYDLESRQLRPTIALLPLNIKKEQRDVFGNLDEVINVLESQHFDAIPVQHVGFVCENYDSDIEQFLEWVLHDGETFNHQQGFLQLEEKEVKQQIKLLANR